VFGCRKEQHRQQTNVDVLNAAETQRSDVDPDVPSLPRPQGERGERERERERENVFSKSASKNTRATSPITQIQYKTQTRHSKRTHQSRCNSELVSTGDPRRLTYASIALRVGRYSGKKEVHIVRWELHVLIQVRRIGMHSLIFAPRKREHRADLTHVRRCRCRAWSAPAEVPRTYSTQAFTEGVSLRCKGVRAIHTQKETRTYPSYPP
jgi:hypothetical protein